VDTAHHPTLDSRNPQTQTDPVMSYPPYGSPIQQHETLEQSSTNLQTKLISPQLTETDHIITI